MKKTYYLKAIRDFEHTCAFDEDDSLILLEGETIKFEDLGHQGDEISFRFWWKDDLGDDLSMYIFDSQIEDVLENFVIITGEEFDV